MKFEKICITLAILAVFLLCIGSVAANDLEDIDAQQSADDSSIDIASKSDDLSDNSLLSYDNEASELEQSDEIEVTNWEELRYYCSLNDTDYVLNLKENTNFYPDDPTSDENQIIINNNVTIIGSSGAYIGDASPDARNITYMPIKVNDKSGIGITIKGVTFKWIATKYSGDAVFLTMGGNATNTIEDCTFENITTTNGHSSILHIKYGDLLVDNCTFTNCTTDFGCISVYCPDDDARYVCTSARMIVRNSYFEGNYAKTEPGCINNCGKLTVYNTTFYKNSAFWWAGAIHTHGGGNTTIYSSNFTDNVAGWNGGALYTYSYLQIYNTTFTGNNCTTNNGGGAIGACNYGHAPCIYIEGCLFQENNNNCWSLDELSTSGTGRGGAISFMDEGTIDVRNTTFIHNSAAMGSAIAIIQTGSYGTPTVTLLGNTFINNTKTGDVLYIYAGDSVVTIANNSFYNSTIVFSKFRINAEDPVGDNITVNIDAALNNPSAYDSDILDKLSYDVYVDGVFYKTIVGTKLVYCFEDDEKHDIYIYSPISGDVSNTISVSNKKEFIYVSKNSGNDNNDGISNTTPVATLAKAISLASATGNIYIMDGTFCETNLNIDYDLSIVGAGNVVISGTAGNIFNSTATSLEVKNIKFSNLKYNDDKCFSISANDLLILENCEFIGGTAYGVVKANEINAYDVVFDAMTVTNEMLNANIFYGENLIVSNNDYDGNTQHSLFIGGSITTWDILNSRFENNTNLKAGCIYLKGTSASDVNIYNVTFDSNSIYTGSTAYSSGIYLASAMNVKIDYSLFINNENSAYSRGAVINSQGATILITNSVFLNNTHGSRATIFYAGSSNLAKITAEYNWFGNIGNTAPDLDSKINYNYWYTVNVSSSQDKLGPGETAIITLDLNKVITRDGEINNSKFNYPYVVKLALSADYGKLSAYEVILNEGFAQVEFTKVGYNDSSINVTYFDEMESILIESTKNTPNLTVKTSNITAGDDLVIYVSLDSDATGETVLKINGEENTLVFNEGSAVFTKSNVVEGNYTISVVFKGDSKYLSKNITEYVTSTRLDSGLSVATSNITAGDNLVIIVNLADDVKGSTILYVNDENQTLTFTDGVAEVTLPKLKAGNYSISAVFEGDTRYSPSTVTEYVTSTQLESFISIAADDFIYVDESLDVVVTVPSNATGNITVNVGSKTLTEKINNGKVSFSITDISANNYTLKAIYAGDIRYAGSENTKSLTVSKYNSSTSISANLNDLKVGDDVVITVNVESDATGYVTINLNGNEEDIPIDNGKAVYTINDITKGDYVFKASYNGDSKYLASEDSVTFYVAKLNSTVNVSVENINYGENATVIVTPISGASGNVTVTIGNKNYNGSINGSSAIITIPGLSAGDKEVYVVYHGDENYIPSNNTTTFNVAKINPEFSISANSVMVGNKVTVKITFNKAMTGKFTLSIGNLTTSKTIRKGGTVADWSVSNLSPDNYTVNIIYAGDDNFNEGSNFTNFTVFEYPSAQVANGETNKNSPYEGLTNGNVLFEIDLQNSIDGSIVIDSDGNIYFASASNLFAYNKNGELIWNYSADEGVAGSLSGVTVGRNILISPFSGNRLFFVNITSGKENSRSNMYYASSLFPPVIDDEFNVYITSEYQYSKGAYCLVIVPYSFWQSSTSPIMIAFGKSVPISSPVIVDENKVAIATVDGLRIIDISTKSVVYSGNEYISRFTVGQMGEIYALTTDSVVCIIDEVQQWKTKVTGGAGEYLVLDSTLGYLYSANGNGVLYKYDISSGEESLVCDFGDNITSNILIDNQGALYLGTESGKFYSLDSEGNILWKVNLGDKITGNPVIDEDGLVYVIVNGSKIVKLGISELKDTVITADIKNVTYGENSTVLIDFDELTGDISISIGDKVYNKSSISTKDNLTVSIQGLASGNYTASIVYSGDNRFKQTTLNVDFKVLKRDTTLIAKSTNITVGESESIEIILPNGATGNVTMTVGTENKNITVNNESTVVILDNLASGTYSVVFKYNGNDNFSSCENATSFTVSKVKMDNFTVEFSGSSYSINLPADAGGYLVVMVDGAVYRNVTVVKGVASASVSGLPGGNHAIQVIYSGDAKYGSISKSSTLHVPVIEITGGNVVMLYTSGAYYKVRLTSDGAALVGKSVTLVVNGIATKAITDNNGYASVKLSLIPKSSKYSAYATYGSLKVSNTIKVKSIMSAKNLKVKKTAKYLIIKVTLKKVNGKYLKSKKITLKFKGKKYKVKTNKKGVAKFKIPKKVIKKLKAGKKYKYKAVYLKDSIKKTVKVKK